jgi:probable HAF family extracellular repeat protein
MRITCNRFRPVAVAAAFVMLVFLTLPLRSVSAASGVAPVPRYALTILSTLGAHQFDAANAAGVNDLGWVVGDANVPGSTGVNNATEHPTLWRNGVITDLGTLGGPNGSIGFVARPNDSGLITGNAQNSTVDPLGEGWGTVFGCDITGDICSGPQDEVRGFAWKDGVMKGLPTLGGNNALGFGVANQEGQMVGTAETGTTDARCVAPQQLDWEPVLWGPRPGEVHQLPTYPGDTVGYAAAINDWGQAVGGSGFCGGIPNFPFINHALLWQGGSPVNLGSLGGQDNNVADNINDPGQVVGWSDLTGDISTHAFLWQHGVMRDLGTLPGDADSFAYGINDAGQVVGQSCDASGNCRAVLWEGGTIIDLNNTTSLPPKDGPVDLILAEGINSWGEIVGVDDRNGIGLAFTLVPCDRLAATARACGTQKASSGDRTNVPHVHTEDVGHLSMLRIGLVGG